MIDSEFRSLLHDRLGPALDELVAPDLLDRVRTRQVRHKHSVRAGLAAASAAGVAAVVVAVALWPDTESAGPTAPASSLSAPAVPSSAVPSSAGLTSPAPSPSTAIVNLAGLAPLVTSGPCAGLTVGAFLESGDIHPAITAITAVGASFTTGSGQLLDIRTKGPCVDRLSYIQRTATFQRNLDVPYSFIQGQGGVATQGSATNQTGIVQLYLDCKGFVCSGSGAPLATVTVRVRGNGIGAGSQPFAAVSTPFPVPTGDLVTVPSVLGMPADDAFQLLARAAVPPVEATASCPCASSGPRSFGVVLSQSPRAGAVVPRNTGEYLTVSGDGAPLSPNPAHASVAVPEAARPSLAAPTSAPMPSVLGLALAKAEAVLQKDGIAYAVTYAFRPAPSHTITFQNPKPGVAVLSSTVVQLTVSLGPAPRQQ